MPLPVEFIPFDFMPFWFDFIAPFEFIPPLPVPLPDSMLPVPEVPPAVPLPAPSAAQAVVANPIANATDIAIYPDVSFSILLFVRNVHHVLCGNRGIHASFPQTEMALQILSLQCRNFTGSTS
jgi:hypothetical protein